jgi:hypothetical protein
MHGSPRSQQIKMITLSTILLLPLVMQLSPPPVQEAGSHLSPPESATAQAGVSAGQT